MSYSNNSKEYPSFPGTEKETVEQVVSRQRATNNLRQLNSKWNDWKAKLKEGFRGKKHKMSDKETNIG